MGSLGPGVHQVLSELSKHLRRVWGCLILNMICPLLPSCWGYSFALGHGVSIFGGIQHPLVDSCSVVNCNFGVLTGEDVCTLVLCHFVILYPVSMCKQSKRSCLFYIVYIGVICKIQQRPQDWKRSVFTPILKKDNAKECSNYHTIALISHLAK